MAEQDLAETRAILARETSTPIEILGQLSPEDIDIKIQTMREADADLRRKANRLKLLKEAAAKLN